jgi:chromosome segregation ATPase
MMEQQKPTAEQLQTEIRHLDMMIEEMSQTNAGILKQMAHIKAILNRKEEEIQSLYETLNTLEQQRLDKPKNRAERRQEEREAKTGDK